MARERAPRPRRRAWLVARDSSGVEATRVELVPRRPLMSQQARPVLVAVEDALIPEGSIVTIEHEAGS